MDSFTSQYVFGWFLLRSTYNMCLYLLRCVVGGNNQHAWTMNATQSCPKVRWAKKVISARYGPVWFCLLCSNPSRRAANPLQCRSTTDLLPLPSRWAGWIHNWLKQVVVRETRVAAAAMLKLEVLTCTAVGLQFTAVPLPRKSFDGRGSYSGYIFESFSSHFFCSIVFYFKWRIFPANQPCVAANNDHNHVGFVFYWADCTGGEFLAFTALCRSWY